MTKGWTEIRAVLGTDPVYRGDTVSGGQCVRAAWARGRKVPHCSSSDGTDAQCREEPGQVSLHMHTL